MPYDWIDRMIYPVAGVPLTEPATGEGMTPFESPYDPEQLQYRLAQARSMQDERPPLPMGGNRQERALAGFRSSLRGIGDWFTARRGERMEKGAMADIFAHHEAMKTYKKELAVKINREFDKLYNGDPTDDKQAIANLRKLSFNAHISFGDDFGIGANLDKYVTEKRMEAQTIQEAGWKERELAVKEREKPAEIVSTKEKMANIKTMLDQITIPRHQVEDPKTLAKTWVEEAPRPGYEYQYDILRGDLMTLIGLRGPSIPTTLKQMEFSKSEAKQKGISDEDFREMIEKTKSMGYEPLIVE